jgi:hypothetical protein
LFNATSHCIAHPHTNQTHAMDLINPNPKVYDVSDQEDQQALVSLDDVIDDDDIDGVSEEINSYEIFDILLHINKSIRYSCC